MCEHPPKITLDRKRVEDAAKDAMTVVRLMRMQ